MNRRILVVIGNPIADSLNHALARAYVTAAEAAGGDVRLRDLGDNPAPLPVKRAQLRAQPDDLTGLEPGVAEDLTDLAWAEHVVIFFPQWWGTYPAVLKNWIDRTFLSGFAFRYGSSAASWEKLLAGRTARLVMTHDTPELYNRIVYRDAAVTSLRRATLGYCGIKTVGVTRLSPVKTSSDQTRNTWLSIVAALGTKDARAASLRRASTVVAR